MVCLASLAAAAPPRARLARGRRAAAAEIARVGPGCLSLVMAGPPAASRQPPARLARVLLPPRNARHVPLCAGEDEVMEARVCDPGVGGVAS